MDMKNFQCARQSLVSRVHYKAPQWWARKKAFQNKSAHKAGKCCVGIGFGNAVFHKRSILQII